MPQTDAHLLTLIQLLEGMLPAEQGAAVRERLAEDADLREHFRLLSEAVEPPTSPADAESLDFRDLETAAAFVEGRLTTDEAAEFESRCWRSPSLLRETVAAFRATMSVPSDVAIPHGVRERMFDVIGTELGRHPIVPSDDAKTNGRPLRERSGRTATRKRPMRRNGSLPPVPQQAASPSSPAGSRRTLTATIVGTVVLLAIAAVAIIVSNRDPDADSKPTAKTNGQSPNDVVRENDDHGPVPRKSYVPDPGPSYPPPKRDPAIAKRPQGKRMIDPSPRKPKTPAGRVFATIHYGDVYGVVGRRSDDAGKWQGVLYSDDGTPDDKPVTLRTLPTSWMRAKFSTGLEFVLDADSEVRISSRSLPREPKTSVIAIDVRRGRVALLGLKRNDRIRLLHAAGNREAARRLTMRAMVAATAVGFVRDEETPGDVVVWDGGVDLGSRKVDGGHRFRWNGRQLGRPEKSTGKDEWRTRPLRRPALRAAFYNRFNRSPDLMRSLAATPRGVSRKDLLAATNLSFSLDPLNAIPAATTSRIEFRRVAALHWLLRADPNRRMTSAVWRRVIRASDPQATKLTLKDWFDAARKKSRVDATQLRKLSVGLGPNQPIFIRQSAIYFFRQITRQPLREYDPDRPTADAIAKVRQIARRVLMSQRRRGRGTRKQP